MITIVDAGIAHGYSSDDHLITGREASGVIGRQFRSVREALTAARIEAGENCDRGLSVDTVEVEVRFANGETRWFK